MTNNAQAHLPYAQSFKNFSRMEPCIKLALDAVLPAPVGQDRRHAWRHAWRFDPLRFEHSPLSPETFAARFRDAVRYGLKHCYLSSLFTPQQLADLESVMRVSMNIEPPFVWVYHKDHVPSVNANNSVQEQAQAQPLNGTETSAQGQTTITFEIPNDDILHKWLCIKNFFRPSLVITAKLVGFHLTPQAIVSLESLYDCSIALVDDDADDKANTYLIA